MTFADGLKFIFIEELTYGLPAVTSAVFLIAKSLVKSRHLAVISEMPLLPLRGSSVSGMYVYIKY
jgi:hypothetical protein